MATVSTITTERVRVSVQGVVQGVGFRPFVYGLALRFDLRGFVLNNSAGVTIEVEGAPHALDAFRRALTMEAPPLARVTNINWEQLLPVGDSGFVIAHSQAGSKRHALVSPDTSTCDDCLRELFDPADRRYHYPFTNCTNCGPRFTIVQDVPYDRAFTTMSAFPMCGECQAEYDDPLNRRFHAQPNACPVCGPQVRLLDKEWSPISVEDVISDAARRLSEGAIIAVKGIGGYHLACDALNAEAVYLLRARKRREAKPFALMVPDLETAAGLCEVSDYEADLLQSRRRPIVLLKHRSPSPVAPDIAPGHKTLGIMLPYTPLHYLLLRRFAAMKGAGSSAALVMTSGNISDEPIAYQDEDARIRLASIADFTLTHNRDIHIRCDDSIARIVAGGEQIFRRSRSYAPEPLSLPIAAPIPLLATGGHLKNTFCLAKGQQAFVSHHIGDMENLEALTSFKEGIEHYSRLFDIQPQAVAYDLHPEYMATKFALGLDLPHKVGVQHHHAHIASVIAEHGLEGTVIGVAADGTGYGIDGAIWGCEIMVADLLGFERVAHLQYVPLPGGEQAVRQPWRMAAVYLERAFGQDFLTLDIPFVRGLNQARWRPLAQMISKGINAPLTSSLGRLFDAVAALLGVRQVALYEGQAAIELEMQAEPSEQTYPFNITGSSLAQLDVTPMFKAIVEEIRQGVPVPRIAGNFHRTVAEMLAASCIQARAASGHDRVALSGGVFQNKLLLEQMAHRLKELGFEVYINRRVPPNDGGLSYGQAAVAAAILR
ncbi:MAG: carbamoyltransferase HypF [Chloroflexia bacterium]